MSLFKDGKFGNQKEEGAKKEDRGAIGANCCPSHVKEQHKGHQEKEAKFREFTDLILVKHTHPSCDTALAFNDSTEDCFVAN